MTTKKTAGLMPRSEQHAHREAITLKALSFLQDETYSTTAVLQELLGYTSRQGIKGMLNKLVKEHLVKHHPIKNLAGRGIDLWGITKRGLYAIDESGVLPDNVRGFEPSRVSLMALPHKVEVQKVKIALLNCGWSIDNIQDHAWQDKIPDIVISHPTEDAIFALEIELHVKSQKRYAAVIQHYKAAHNSEQMDRVYWLAEDDKMANQLAAVFHRIDPTVGDVHIFQSLEAFKKKLKPIKALSEEDPNGTH